MTNFHSLSLGLSILLVDISRSALGEGEQWRIVPLIRLPDRRDVAPAYFARRDQILAAPQVSSLPPLAAIMISAINRECRPLPFDHGWISTSR